MGRSRADQPPGVFRELLLVIDPAEGGREIQIASDLLGSRSDMGPARLAEAKAYVDALLADPDVTGSDLKGLLNRNPDARLGNAKSTMFEVGGVAGLKQSAFFEKLDWVKLEQKELKPPYDLSVDNHNDLRHFHDEFTNLPLPRSVREMTDRDIKPRRVESEFFRECQNGG